MSQTEPSQEWPPSSSEVEASGPPRDEQGGQGGAERYVSEPVHAPEPVSPYGVQPSAYGAPASPYGTQPSPYGAPPTDHRPAPASTIVLLVVSGLLTLTGVGLLWAAPAVLSIMALVKHPADPAGARRLTRIGWWIAAALGALALLAVLAVLAALILVPTLLGSIVTSGYTPSTVGLTTAFRTMLAPAGL